MDIINIKKIMKSDSWKRIEKDEYYLNHIVLDTLGKKIPWAKRKRGHFFAFLVFFKSDVSNSTLKKYYSEWIGLVDGTRPVCEYFGGVPKRYRPYKLDYGVKIMVIA